MVDPQALKSARTGDLVQVGGSNALVLGALQKAERTWLALLADKHEARSARKAMRALRDIEGAIFTPTGSAGGSFQLDVEEYSAITLAIMPVDLAETLLAVARRSGGLSAQDRTRLTDYVTAYFQSLPRLVGSRSGTIANEDCDVSNTRRLQLDRDLAAADWRPPQDMLERLALADPWIREALLPPVDDGPQTEPGLTAFFVRERAVDLGFLPKVHEAISSTGFEILASIALSGDIAEEMRKSSRGGNWGSGPFLVSGGPPRHMLIAFDAFPVHPRASTLRMHPLLDNARSLYAKSAARHVVAAFTRPRKGFNPLHSSDHSFEAFRIAEMLLTSPENDALIAGVAARRHAVQSAIETAELLEGRNVTAACLRGNGVVRRVFRPHLSHCAASVVEIQRLLQPGQPELCEIVRADGLTVDFADPGPEFAPAASLTEPLPLPLILRLRRLLGDAARKGVVLDRWEPGLCVFVNDAKTEIRVMGFDQARRLDKPQKLKASFMDVATSANIVRLTGIPIRVFIHGASFFMRLSRSLFQPAALIAARGRTRVSHLAWAVLNRIRRSG